jgi:Phosphatidylinositol-4-phosphate 5-Kinase
MQNVFYNKKISKIFDLKGSLRGRFAASVHHQQGQNPVHQHTSKQHSNHIMMDDGARNRRGDAATERHGKGDDKNKVPSDTDSRQSSSSNSIVDDGEGGIEISISHRNSHQNSHAPALSGKSEKYDVDTTGTQTPLSTLLDGDFLEFTSGRPMPLTDRAKAVFQMSILNDTLFLNYIYVLDYSILVGFDEETNELVVGIIDFMRQYDILKQMERVGKSLPMVVGSEAPTIIQPPLYKARFTNAMERYFMTVPSKWTTI